MNTQSQYFNKFILTGVLIATAVTLTFYTINMVVFLNTTVFSIALYMPLLVGTISGYIFGFLYNQRIQKQKALYQSLEQQDILNNILLLPHQNYKLEELLQETIKLTLEASFAQLQSKGGIFLSTYDNRLVLKSHINLSPQLIEKCGVKGVEFGECLCGLAAAEKKTIYKNCVDHDHTLRFEDMEDHGHYNVPIIYNDEVLGVLVVYLDVNHQKNKVEIDFLEHIAIVLAIILNKISTDNKALQSESKLKEVQEFAGIGTWTMNIKTGAIEASDEVYSIMGYKPQQFKYTEESFLQVTHNSDVGRMKEAFENAKKGEPFEVEMRHFRKDGTVAHIINKCKPRVLENGFIPELSGTIIDVSKLRDNEAELSEQQDLVNGILSATPDMLYLIDLGSNELIYYNRVMSKVLDENPNFLIRFKEIGIKIFYELAHPDDVHLFDEMDKILRSGQDFYTFSFRTKAIGGTFRWLEQRVFVYSRGKNGYIKQVLIVSKDIHEQMLAEERVRKLNDKLLVQFKDIKKVNTELDQFVYSVSHDLRAPLSSILGLVNISKKESDKQLLRECIARIGTSTEKLDEFIKDILDYSRNSRTEIDATPFSIETLVNELIDNIKLLRNPNIKLELSSNEKPTYIGDRRRISIILNNIISNSCKYADPAKANSFVKIDIKSNKDGCIINIKDNGIGISSTVLDNVFDMFYRGTETSDGSGLGLYIVKESISKLNGQIELTSEEGAGTNIAIQIPHSDK